jgi:hypothetical protein
MSPLHNQHTVTDTTHHYTVTGWGAEFAFYSGLTLDELSPNEEEGTDGLEDYEPDANKVLVGDVEVVSKGDAIHKVSFDHPDLDWKSTGLVRPLLLKWVWELELDSEFDPSKLSFSDSALVYDGTVFEAEFIETKGEDEPYEV